MFSTLFNSAFIIKSAKNSNGAKPLPNGQGMEVDESGEENTKHLSCCHHCCKEESSKVFNGIINHNLSQHRCQ